MLPPHRRQAGANEIERSPEVRLQGILEVLAGGVVEGRHLDDAGVVDEQVHAAALANDLLDQALVGALVTDVSLDDLNAAAPPGNIGLRAVEFLPIARDEDHVGALRREPPRKRKPQSTAASGDDDRLAVEAPLAALPGSRGQPRRNRERRGAGDDRQSDSCRRCKGVPLSARDGHEST